MDTTAKLTIDEKTYELPLVEGTEGNRALDISKLLRTTGCVTLDEGYANTGSTPSAITFLDGEKGILRYRGYPVEVLAERCDFIEVAYLLIYGELPTPEQLEEFRTNIRPHTMLHEGMKTIFAGFPPDAHPMAILSSVVGALADLLQGLARPPQIPSSESWPSTACWPRCPRSPRSATSSRSASRSSIRENHLTYCQNFLHMMFAVPSERYHMDPDFVDALNLLLILHADHGQNCSTSAVRMVGSSNANLFSAISAGICACGAPGTAGPTRPASRCWK